MDMGSLAGHLVDLVIACILLEAMVLRWRRPRALSAAMPSLAAGLALALSLRFALAGAVWPWVWLCMGAAGAAHAVDVARRWRTA